MPPNSCSISNALHKRDDGEDPGSRQPGLQQVPVPHGSCLPQAGSMLCLLRGSRKTPIKQPLRAIHSGARPVPGNPPGAAEREPGVLVKS